MRDPGRMSTDADLRLRSLCVRDEKQAVAAHHELAAEGFGLLEAWTPTVAWAAYIERLGRMSTGYDLPEGWVPFTLLAAEVAAELVGAISIRHELNAQLAEVGGHIGYAVRPRHRGRGYATQMLRQALQVSAKLGIDNALLTCDDDNVASAAVIERCGGVLTQVLPPTDVRRAKRHYWIRTGDQTTGRP
jgi:predicted acetyltransferase